jgi:hypothetical protein
MFIPKIHRDIAPEGVPSTPSVAQMMATQGAITQEGTQTVEAAPHTQGAEPANVSPDTTQTAETATVPSTETGAEATPAAATETVAEAQPAATEQAPAPLPSWQDLIKTQPREQVLTELGVEPQSLTLAQTLKENPQMEAFFKHWQEKGDVVDYLRELTTDYTKMPAEDVMRHQLRQAYPKADERTLDLLYKREVVNKYGLDPDRYSEEEIEEGRLLLEVDADKFRGELSEKQKQFLIPPPAEKPAEAAAAPVDNSAAEVEAYKQTFSADPLFKTLSESKVFTLGEGDEKFSFPVDPNEVTSVLFDTDKWGEKMFTRQGDAILPNTRQHLLVGMITAYGDKFLNAYAQHMKALGGKTVIDPIENASVPSNATPSVAQVTPDNPAAAMAKMGRMSY